MKTKPIVLVALCAAVTCRSHFVSKKAETKNRIKLRQQEVNPQAVSRLEDKF